MVLISSTKYACETCIKGHRSSACKHTDRPLFEIKKKGRPVTQCDHCRELRKTKQVHVKCLCEAKEDAVPTPSYTTSGKRAHTKVPESATFPNGLPAALEVATLSETTSAASSNNGVGCTCGVNGECHCCTARTAVRKNNTVQPAVKLHRPAPTANPHVLARVAQLRPILARPGPVHDPSFLAGSRHHEHVAFSPYSRAYESVHGFEPVPFTESEPDFEELYQQLPSSSQFPSLAEDYNVNWQQTKSDNPYPTLCTCGDRCSCRGCSGLVSQSSSSDPTPCVSSGACSGCLDCTLLSLPRDDTALSIPAFNEYADTNTFDPQPADTNTYDPQSVDDWIQQLSSHGSSSPVDDESPTSMINQSYAPPPWNDLQSTPKMIETTMASEAEYSDEVSVPNMGCCSSAKAKSLPDVRLTEQWMPLPVSEAGYHQSVFADDAYYLQAPDMGMSRSRSSSFSTSSQSSTGAVSSVFSSADYSNSVRPSSPSAPAGRVQSRGRRTVSTKDSEDLLSFLSACCSKGTVPPPPSSIASVHEEASHPSSPYHEGAYARSNPELYTSSSFNSSPDIEERPSTHFNFNYEDVEHVSQH